MLIWQDLYSGKVKGIGRKQCGLYVVVADINKRLMSNEIKITHLSSKDEDYDLLHKRLGHPSSTVMRKIPALHKCTSIINDNACHICPLAK